ncbi:hypothetical protein KIH39_17335 [Telmatocola sphagniphila]|uniref:Uncharacterized protein n=1 Tax=Telmatocola sphagniphila TaxID=1123043 RepID=A0A8E6B3F8_9BACT|nr:hypothetical protein [Telmatocola sphagniphila]QVL30609.1 hypothetical protein KIH39_17335 [Telmatocola sphagniphila]
MKIVWALIVLTLLAVGASLLFQSYGHMNTVVLPVPPDDVELAWIHTSTNSATWERFVTGCKRLANDGWTVDDSKALLEETTGIPEVTITRPSESRKVRIRWYKLSSETGSKQWVKALSKRNPAPIAIIGGGSSDRAEDLARSLYEQGSWKGGVAPLLFLTTATADEIKTGPDDYKKLINFYPGRTFRFCFSNLQMARAVMECIDQTDLHPSRNFPPFQRQLMMMGQHTPLDLLMNLILTNSGLRFGTPHRFAVLWRDDPYSSDLLDRFEQVIQEARNGLNTYGGNRLVKLNVPFSVGTYNHANPSEEEAVRELLSEISTAPGERALLILPTVAAPARRVLRSLCGDAPMIGKNIVVVTGDAISFNTFYRDAEFAWNVRDIPVPIATFLHQNPVGWDEGITKIAPLQGPNSTEDILLYQDMMSRIMNSILPKDKKTEARDADTLRDNLISQNPDFFDKDGNRQSGQNEYVVIFRPIFLEGDRVRDEPQIEIWNRPTGQKWKLVQQLGKYNPPNPVP